MSSRAVIRWFVAPYLLVATMAAGSLVMPAAAAEPGVQGGREDGVASPEGNFSLGGQPCNLIGVPAVLPVGVTRCEGVRPGGPVRTATGLCTFNFMFRGSDGARYMGTAGHCAILDATTGTLPGFIPEEEHVYAPGSRPVAMDGKGRRIGEFAYAILSQPQEMDFALIRLDEGVEASPQMCHFGGPVGINTDTPALTEPVVLHQYGHGIGLGSLLPGRSLLALGMPSPYHVFAMGAVLPGDSGSGVTSADGRAVGVAVTTGLHTGSLGASGIDTGLAGITRLTPQLARAEEMLATDLELVTAPLL